jgi:hypothetical protein
MHTQAVRSRLRQAFAGTFLLRKRCRCTVHVFGRGPTALIDVEPCKPCLRYDAFQRLRRGRA